MSDDLDKKSKPKKALNKALQAELGVDKEKLKQLKKKLAKIEGYPEKGIETWFRITSKNLYTRRQIVDTKSNILITVNSIIISVILGSLYTQMDEDPHLIWGIGPMILTNMLSITFAIFATRPNLRTGEFSPEEVQSKSARLMTFDDFNKMSEEDYERAVTEMMQDGDFLYRTLKRDIYHLGVDLGKRYKSIQIAYNVFLFGLTISLFFFGMCHVLF